MWALLKHTETAYGGAVCCLWGSRAHFGHRTGMNNTWVTLPGLVNNRVRLDTAALTGLGATVPITVSRSWPWRNYKWTGRAWVMQIIKTLTDAGVQKTTTAARNNPSNIVFNLHKSLGREDCLIVPSSDTTNHARNTPQHCEWTVRILTVFNSSMSVTYCLNW